MVDWLITNDDELDDDVYVANVPLRYFFEGETQSITLSTVHLVCGLCGNNYEMSLSTGDLKMLECPDCGNMNLQMVKGV